MLFPDDVFCDVIWKEKKRRKNADAVLCRSLMMFYVGIRMGTTGIKCKSQSSLAAFSQNENPVYGSEASNSTVTYFSIKSGIDFFGCYSLLFMPQNSPF